MDIIVRGKSVLKNNIDVHFQRRKVIYFTIYFFRLTSKLVKHNTNKDSDERRILCL